MPPVGPGIAAAIGAIAQTGRWSRLDRLRGTVDTSAVFRTIPGVGPQLAQRLHDGLDADSLEALEGAAHDGRLERLPQVDARRTARRGCPCCTAGAANGISQRSSRTLRARTNSAMCATGS